MNDNVKVNIGGTDFIVKYPNVKQKLEIESAKMFLSKDEYGKLARSGHKTAAQILDLVDAVSYFTVLIPEIGKNMTMGEYEEMDYATQMSYVRAFKMVFWPWMEKIEQSINDTEDDTDKERSME